MEERFDRLIRFHDVLSEVDRTIMSEHNRQELLEEACRLLVDEGKFQAAWIGLSDPTTMDLKFVAAHGGRDDFREEFQVTLDNVDQKNEPIGLTLLEGKSFWCNDISNDQRVISWRSEARTQGYESVAAVPLRFGERLIGILVLWSNQPNLFADEEITIFERLGAVLSTALVQSKKDEQRKRAEEELRESEARYRRLAENVLELVSQINSKYIFQYVSPSHKRALGYEVEELLGKSFLEMVHEDDLNTTRAALQTVASNGCTKRMEVRFRHAKSQYLLLEVVVDPLYGETEEITGFILGSRNITERRQAEDKLRRYAEKLEEMVRERTERIRKLNETVTERLIQKVNQINHISELRESLKSSPGVSQGFQIILDSSTRDLGMTDAAILTVSVEKRIVEVRAVKSTRPIDVKTTYSLDAPFAEYECLNNDSPTSRIALKEPSILGTRSLHCCSISLENQVRGILALGNDNDLILDESDLSVLRLYSGLVGTVLETSTLTVEPMKEAVKKSQSKYTLEFGRNYIVADNTDLAYDVFTDKIMSGIEGLCITRTLPSKVREKYGLKKTPIIWLTNESVKGERTISSLQDISILISNYVEKVEKPVILIDGIEYLNSHQGFESVYHFLQAKRTQVEAAEGILIIPFFQGALDQKEVKLLEREFEAFAES